MIAEGVEIPFYLEHELRARHPRGVIARLSPYMSYYWSTEPGEDQPPFPTTLFVVDTEEVEETYVRTAARMSRMSLPILVSCRPVLFTTGILGRSWHPLWESESPRLALSTLLNLGMVFRPTVPMITFARVKTPDKVPDQRTGLSTEALYTQPRPSCYDPTADSPYITNYQIWKLAKCAKLTADFPTLHNESEYTVLVDGDIGVIAPYRGGDFGTAGVFIRGSKFGRWTLAAKLTASDSDDQDII